MSDLKELQKELKEIRDKTKSKYPKQNQSTSSSILDQDYINKIASSASAVSGSQIRDFKASPFVIDFSDHEELFASHEIQYLKNNSSFYPEDTPDPQLSKVTKKDEEVFKQWVKEKSKELGKNTVENDRNPFGKRGPHGDEKPLFGDDNHQDSLDQKPLFGDDTIVNDDKDFEHPFTRPSTTNTPDSTTESSSFNVGGMFKSIKNMFK